MEEKIEVLDETPKSQTNYTDEVISLDRLFNEDDEQVIDAYEEDQQLEKIRQQKITRIQLGLIIFLVVFASLVYFFGYNFLEPYIKID